MKHPLKVYVKVIGTHALIIGGFAAAGTILHDVIKLMKDDS